MELRKDPITRSWVRMATARTYPSRGRLSALLGELGQYRHALLELPSAAPPSTRHPAFPSALTIEGEPARVPEGIYDRMRPVGAHEIIIESPDHNLTLARMSDDQIARVLEAYTLRILDLKTRFAIQICRRLRESRRALRRGMGPSLFAGHRDDVRAAAHSL